MPLDRSFKELADQISDRITALCTLLGDHPRHLRFCSRAPSTFLYSYWGLTRSKAATGWHPYASTSLVVTQNTATVYIADSSVELKMAFLEAFPQFIADMEAAFLARNDRMRAVLLEPLPDLTSCAPSSPAPSQPKPTPATQPLS